MGDAIIDVSGGGEGFPVAKGFEVTSTEVTELLLARSNVQGFDTADLVFGDGTPLSIATTEIFDECTGGDTMVRIDDVTAGIEGVLGFLASQNVTVESAVNGDTNG